MFMYVKLACLMLLAALSNAICMYNWFFPFFAIDICKCFLLSCFIFVYGHIDCLIQVLFSIMHSTFNLFVLPNSMFALLIVKGPCAQRRNRTKNNHCKFFFTNVGMFLISMYVHFNFNKFYLL